MNQEIHFSRYSKTLMTLFLLGILSGCASVNFEQSLAKTNQIAADFTQGKLSLAQTKDQREELGRVAGEGMARSVRSKWAVCSRW